MCLYLNFQNIKTFIYTDDTLIQNNNITKYTDETASDHISNNSNIICTDEEILTHIKNNDIKTILTCFFY